MAVSYGFYDSINRDRLYNAKNFNQYLEGIVNDGVFKQIGNHFNVTQSDSLRVHMGPGKALTNGLWTYNDSDMVFQFNPEQDYYYRYDSIALIVNENERINNFVIKVGTPAIRESDLVVPEMIKSGGYNEYRIADILIYGSSIRTVYNRVGEIDLPFVSFSDFPFGANYTKGYYNAGNAGEQNQYFQLLPGIDVKYMIIIALKTIGSGDDYCHVQSEELIRPRYVGEDLNSATMLILQRGAGSNPSDFYAYYSGLDGMNIPNNYARRFNLNGGRDEIPLVKCWTRIDYSTGDRTPIIEFSKDYFAGYGVRAWFAFGDILSE